MTTRRQTLNRLLGLSLLYPLVACGDGNRNEGLLMKADVVLDVVLFNYLDRPIFDVLLNRGDIGVAGAYGGGRGVMTGVTVPVGHQTLTWRDAGSGDTVTAKNFLNFTPDQIPPDARYLGVHIYPDDTAELMTSPHFPEPSPRGELIYKEKHLYGR
ncbi:hypothetical protein [Paraburkholderia strydomiana]|uniref:hypothetical protein n=1 Tax=Paraburkholderia strydomiana TaxID=1245417 RepID=UPI001BE6FD60|nr:hypothetical protein [Paraburkholderia strydomiana]MBT2790353.1 hypothetical protein [Paraburkholderia strydomiana]